MDKPLLSIKGEIENPLQLSFTDLAAIDPAKQIVDVSRIAAGRKGDAVPLSALLALARPKPTAKYLGSQLELTAKSVEHKLAELDRTRADWEKNSRSFEHQAAPEVRALLRRIASTVE